MTQLFCPRLPLDPFAAIDHNVSWTIPQNLPHSHPQLILILGDPPIDDLIPLLTSVHFSRSLVLIATDTPPPIPPLLVGPGLRILRLTQPLAAHDAGALRLVGLLERAQRVAHLWPRDSSPHIIQFAQTSSNGDFSIIEPFSYAHPCQKLVITELGRYPSPAPSTEDSVSSSKSPPQSTPTHSPHKKLHRPKPTLKNSDDKVNYKLFDAIINFLPHDLPDKALLKHTILVTTLTSQFLAPPTCISTTSPFSKTDSKTKETIHSPSPYDSHSPPSQTTSSPPGISPATSPCPSPLPQSLSRTKDLLPTPTATSGVKKRFSLLYRAVPPLPRSEFIPLSDDSIDVKNAHIVHVLPVGWSPNNGDKRMSSILSPLRSDGSSRQSHSAGYFKTPNDTIGIGKPKLVQSIEQFLLSFAYPLGSVVSTSGFDLRSGSAHPSTDISSPPSPASTLKKRPTSVQLLSPTSITNEEEPVTTSRPYSSPGLKGSAISYEQEKAPLRTSTLRTLLSTPNLTISSNTYTPFKPAPYLLAPDIFGRCVLGSGVEQNGNKNNRGAVYMDPYTNPESTALTIGEIILLGALDFESENKRAWIGNVGDMAIVDGGLYSDPGSSSRKIGVGKSKGRKVNFIDTEATKRNVNVSLPTPPESSSSDHSAESVTEEREEETMDSVGHCQFPPCRARLGSNEGVGEGEELTPASQLATINEVLNGTPNNRSELSTWKPSASISTPTLTPASTTFDSKQKTNDTSDKVKDKNSKRFSEPLLPSAVQLPPLVVHRDRARSPRGSGDSYDLGLGHGVPIPLTMVSTKPGSRSASGSGGSGTIPPQAQGQEVRGGCGETRSPVDLSGRKGFVGVLRKMGLWKGGSGENTGMGLKV